MSRIALIVVAGAALASCGPVADEAEPAQPAKAVAHAPPRQGPIPAPPAWAAPYIGKIANEMLPEKEICAGGADILLRRFTGPPAGVAVGGWGWETPAKRRVERILLADESLRIVGAGEGGLGRADVPRAREDIQDPKTGWRGWAPIGSGEVVAYGLVEDGRAVCPLGALGV